MLKHSPVSPKLLVVPSSVFLISALNIDWSFLNFLVSCLNALCVYIFHYKLQFTFLLLSLWTLVNYFCFIRSLFFFFQLFCSLVWNISSDFSSCLISFVYKKLGKAISIPVLNWLHYVKVSLWSLHLSSGFGGRAASEIVAVKRNKRDEFFFFFFFPFWFLRTKKIRRTVSRPEHFLSFVFFFNSNCYLLYMSVTKFAFLPSNSAGTIICTYSSSIIC